MINAIRLIMTMLKVIGIVNFGSSATVAPPYCYGTNTATGSNPNEFKPNNARMFPFCVGEDPETGNWDDVLVKSGFAKLIELIGTKAESYGDPLYYHLVPEDGLKPNQIIEMQPYLLYYKWNPNSKLRYLDYWMAFDLLGLFLKKVTTPILISKPPYYVNRTSWEPRKVVGLYVQAIQGPLGIPFGEFVKFKYSHSINSFDEIMNGSGFQQESPQQLVDLTHLQSCTFHSKAGPTIPNVLIQSSQLDPMYEVRSRIKFTFRWEDHSCAEVAFFQFLIVVVHDWGDPIDYRAVVSQVFLPGRLGFYPNGKPIPQDPNWIADQLTSNRDKFIATVSYGPNDSSEWRKYGIVSNLDYEHCVMHKVGLVRTGTDKGACPPGPFQCAKAVANRPKDIDSMKKRKEDIWEDFKEIYRGYFEKYSRRPSCPPSPPITTTGTTTKRTTVTPTTIKTKSTTIETKSTTIETKPITSTPSTEIEEPLPPTTTAKPRNITQIEKLSAKVTKVAERVETQKVISHGDLSIFIWFVLVPISNYIARFFRDFPNLATFGIGFWIVAHVVIHHVCVLLMWISFGLVVSNGASFFGDASGAHYLFGFAATFIQHVELFHAFIRDRKEQTAQRQTIIHAFVGYVSCIASLMCALNSGIKDMKMYLLLALFFVSLNGFIVGSIIEKKVDKRLGAFPPRKMFPYLHRIMMVNAKPRLYKVKIIVICAYTLALVTLFFLYLFYDHFFVEILN